MMIEHGGDREAALARRNKQYFRARRKEPCHGGWSVGEFQQVPPMGRNAGSYL